MCFSRCHLTGHFVLCRQNWVGGRSKPRPRFSRVESASLLTILIMSHLLPFILIILIMSHLLPFILQVEEECIPIYPVDRHKVHLHLQFRIFLCLWKNGPQLIIPFKSESSVSNIFAKIHICKTMTFAFWWPVFNWSIGKIICWSNINE